VCEPWVAQGGLTDLVGKQKEAGKTTFVLAMIKAIIRGEPFLGKQVVGGPVVVLTEQGYSSMRTSLERAGLMSDHHVHMLFYSDCVPTLAAGENGWARVVHAAEDLVEKTGAVLLVVDTLPQFALRDPGSENDSASALAAVRPLHMLASTQHVGVLVIRHSRKAGGSLADRGRGINAFGGAVDIIMSLEPYGTNTPNARKIEALGRFDVPRYTYVQYVDGSYILGKPLTDRDKNVLQLIENGADGGVTANTVASYLQVTTPTARNVLKKLVEMGFVEHVPGIQEARGVEMRYQKKKEKKI